MEKVLAFVLIGKDNVAGITPERVIEFCKSKIASFKCPKEVVIRTEVCESFEFPLQPTNRSPLTCYTRDWFSRLTPRARPLINRKINAALPPLRCWKGVEVGFEGAVLEGPIEQDLLGERRHQDQLRLILIKRVESVEII